MRRTFIPLLLVASLQQIPLMAEEIPRYKSSSRAPEPLPITSNEYGASELAPASIGIGTQAPDFELPVSGGGTYELSEAVQSGPVALIFYRGHW